MTRGRGEPIGRAVGEGHEAEIRRVFSRVSGRGGAFVSGAPAPIFQRSATAVMVMSRSNQHSLLSRHGITSADATLSDERICI